MRCQRLNLNLLHVKDTHRPLNDLPSSKETIFIPSFMVGRGCYMRLEEHPHLPRMEQGIQREGVVSHGSS